MAESHNFLSADGNSQQHSQLANRTDHQSNLPQLATRASLRVVSWQVRDLKPHPSYVQLGVKTPASRLNELIELGEDAFVFPLFVTSTGIVIDGYARLEIARLQGRETVMCVEFDIPEEEALRRLILCHRRLTGLPAFCRIKLALPLAKSLKQKALQHQRSAAGRAVYGRRKGLVEPVLGTLKEQRGMKRFRLRGLSKVGIEFTLATIAYNLARLYALR